jgi:hypothetical protein
MMDYVSRKQQGILHFGKSQTKRGDEERLMARLKDYAKPVDEI